VDPSSKENSDGHQQEGVEESNVPGSRSRRPAGLGPQRAAPEGCQRCGAPDAERTAIR